VAARYLGVSGLGHLSFILFVETTVLALCTLALPTSLMRHVGELLGSGRAPGLRPLLRWGLKVQGTAAAAGAAILIGAALFGASPTSAWVLAGVFVAAAALHTVPSAVLIGTQRWRQATVVGLVTGVLVMAAKVATLTAGYGLPVLFVIDATFASVNLLGTSYLASRTLSEVAPRSDRAAQTDAVSALRRRVIKFAAVASIQTFVAMVVWSRSELFFLNHYSTDRQIAFYAIPFSFVSALLFIPEAAGRALVPAFATLFGARDITRIKSGYSRAIRMLLLLAFPITAASMALGPTFVTLLYGKSFDASRPVLVILLAALPAVQLLAVSSALLVGLGRPWAPSIIGIFAAAGNLTLDFLLIPRYAAVGAAIANTSAQLLGSIPVAIYASRVVGGVGLPKAPVIRSAAASTAGGACAAALVAVLPPLPALAAGCLCFVTVFFLLAARIGILPKQDAEWLGAAFGGRGHGLPAWLVRRLALSDVAPGF
jgi:O-antigen/teichoic acid export membrane protein